MQINAYYRNNSVRGNNKDKNYSHDLIDSRQKVYFNAIVDRIKGLNMNVFYQGEVSQNYPSWEESLYNLSVKTLEVG